MKQYIYCQELKDIRQDAGDALVDGFCYCRHPDDLVPLLPVLTRAFGYLGLCKIRLKLRLGRRALFAVAVDNHLQHYGWVAFGFCKHYPVAKDSAIIAPVWTDPAARGRGLATKVLKQVIRRLSSTGVRRVYIDTSDDNQAMLQVIRRCGFNILAGTYIRSSDQRPGVALRTRLKKYLPSGLLRGVYCLVGEDAINRARWQCEYQNVLNQAVRIPVREDLPRLGIVKDVMQRHSYYEAACLELGVPYELVDITGANWVDTVKKTDCAVCLVRPYVLNSSGKRLYDDRVRLMTEEMGKQVYPSVKALWLYESKRRTAGWLEANGIPQPQTWCFNDYGDALIFSKTCELPIVFKTDLGSEATGVKLIRKRKDLLKLVKRCFSKGVGAVGYDVDGNVAGELLLQAFIPNAREWRMVRIGDSYFGHRKGKTGDFHSGSKIIEFDNPPDRLLRFVKDVTDKGPFDNMALDILETDNGDYRVIELHCYFGCNSPHVMLVDGEPGRYHYLADSDIWRFEPGDFNRNASCNLRVQHVLDTILI